MAIAETHPGTAPPGKKWVYSNTNYIVAGLLVEAVTGHRVGVSNASDLSRSTGH